MKLCKLLLLCSLLFLSILHTVPTTAQDNTQYPIITAENADQLEEIAVWGRGTIHDVEWPPRDDWIAVGGSRGVWLLNPHDLTTEPLLFEGHTDVVTMVAFHPDGEFLASASRDGTVRIWDLATLETVHIFEDAVGNLVDFSFDGKYLAYNAIDPDAIDEQWLVIIINWETQTRQIFDTNYYVVLDNLQFTENSRYLVTGIAVRSDAPHWDAYIYDIETGEESFIQEDTQLLAYQSPSNNYSYAWAKHVVLSWDTEWFAVQQHIHDSYWTSTQRLNVALIHRETGRAHYLNHTADRLTFSPNSEVLLSLYGNTLYFWDVATGTLIHTYTQFSEPIAHIEFSPDGRWLMTQNSHDITLYDMEQRIEVGRWQALSFVFSPNSQRLAISINYLNNSAYATSRSREYITQIEVWKLDNSWQPEMVATISNEPIEYWFWLDETSLFMYVDQNDNEVVAYGRDPSWELWQIEEYSSGYKYLDLKRDATRPLAIMGDVAYAPQDQDLDFCIANSGYLLICNTEIIYLYGAYISDYEFLNENGGLIHYPYFDLDQNDGTVPLAIGLDGQQIAFAQAGWGGEAARTRRIYTYPVTIYFSNRAAFTLDLTEEERFAEDAYFRNDDIHDMDFHPINNLFVTSEGFEWITPDLRFSRYGFHIWDIETQARIASYNEQHTRPVTTIDFSPDGRLLATGSEDGTVRLWAVRAEE